MEDHLTSNKIYPLILFSGLIILATIVLDAPWLQFQNLALWAQVLVPCLLIIGMIGSALGMRYIRPFGWIGIFLFIVLALNFVFAGEDYIFGGPSGPPLDAPRLPSGNDARLRLGIWLVLSILLLWG